jgi:hypothetical protein
MAFNADYWVAVATAAPVLALANTVTLTSWGHSYLDRLYAGQDDVAENYGELRPVPVYRWKNGSRWARINFGAQIIVTLAALVSLQYKVNELPPWVIDVAITGSMAAIAEIATRAGQDRVRAMLARRRPFIPRRHETEPD